MENLKKQLAEQTSQIRENINTQPSAKSVQELQNKKTYLDSRLH